MPANFFFRLLRGYNHLLNKHKYPVQIATGGFLWFTGDVLCQSLVHLSSQTEEKNRAPFKLDWMRAARMTVYGLGISAPVYAFWYSWLDKAVHRHFAKEGPTRALPGWLERRLMEEPLNGNAKPASFLHRWNPNRQLTLADARAMHGRLRTWQMISYKLLADCFIFDPLYLTLFFTSTKAMEGASIGEIKTKLKDDLPTTYLIDVAVWAPIQTVNFRWIPVVYQALAVQTCNIGWNAYLSFVQHGHH